MQYDRTIWKTARTIAGWLVVGFCVFTQISVDVHADTRIETITFDTTLIGNSDWHRHVIRGLSGSGSYRIDLQSEAPFFFAGSGNDLVIRRDAIWLDIRFQPLYTGARSGMMRLVREPQQGSADTIIVQLIGEAYRTMRTEVVDFGTVITADTVHRRVWIASDEVDQEQWRIIGQDQPAFECLTPDGPIGFGDSVSYRFRFAPLRSGQYADTIGLVRRLNAQDLDTVFVELYAVAVDRNVRAVVDFSTIVTGDSSAKQITFPAATAGNSKYRLDHRPSRPFVSLMIGNDPQPLSADQATIGVAFVPVMKETYTDSLIVIRSNLNDEILDTIKITLVGTGGGLPLSVDGQLDDVKLDQESSITVDAVMSGKPQTSLFQYTLIPLNEGPIVGTIHDPQVPSFNQVISCGFVTKPKTFFDATQHWLLRRIATSTGKQWDSAVINIRQTMRARPINYRMAFGSSELRQRIGDTVEVNLLLITDDPIDVPTSVMSISGSVTYNPTVVVPLTGIGVERVIIDDQPRIQYRYVGPTPVSSAITVVGTLKFVVVMGDTDRTRLDMQRVEIVRGQGDPEEIPASDAEVIVTNVWRYAAGSGRFVNPMVGPLVMDIDPNPIVTDGVLRVRNVPPNAGNLQIIDASGQVIADLTRDIRAGTTSWSISTGEGGILSLSPGSYYARLMCQGEGPDTIYSLVRLFVVQ